MDQRVARNLLAMMAPQLEQAQALIEGAQALDAIANPKPPPKPVVLATEEGSENGEG